MSVISLYDFTGTAMRPWANARHDCFCFDIQHSTVRPSWLFGSAQEAGRQVGEDEEHQERHAARVCPGCV